MTEIVKCRNCPEELEQLPSGTWIDPNGTVYCQRPIDTEERVLHEPIVPPDWRDRIKLLANHRSFWTPAELAKLFRLPEETIKEILAA